jgi:hypothetical protein
MAPTAGYGSRCRSVHLVQDSKELERVGGADDQVVIGVEARVEVERAELAQPEELGDDELDVGPWRVVAPFEAHHSAASERRTVGVRRAPVGNIGVVERGLEELVSSTSGWVPSSRA